MPAKHRDNIWRFHASESDAAATDAWQAAIDFGVDVSLLEYNLTLTPEQRLIKHEVARRRVAAFRQAGKAHYGFDPRTLNPFA